MQLGGNNAGIIHDAGGVGEQGKKIIGVGVVIVVAWCPPHRFVGVSIIAHDDDVSHGPIIIIIIIITAILLYSSANLRIGQSSHVDVSP